MLEQLSTYHGLPSDTVVVSGAFMGLVIFKMMKQGLSGAFDNTLFLKCNQLIIDPLKDINTPELTFIDIFIQTLTRMPQSRI